MAEQSRTLVRIFFFFFDYSDVFARLIPRAPMREDRRASDIFLFHAFFYWHASDATAGAIVDV